MAPLPLQNPDVPKNRQGGICQFLNLQEDNTRFWLLAVLLYVYLACGAFIFQWVEESSEDKMKKDFKILYDEFIRNFTNCYAFPFSSSTLRESGVHIQKFNFGESNSGEELSTSSSKTEAQMDMGIGNLSEVAIKHEHIQLTLDGLHELLFAYGNATQAGVLWKRKRWDWIGSFHFSWTIVSTVGYGATTPATTLGKMLIIPYGFFGCAGGLLFFNLFLERIITFLATCMRKYRLQRQKRRPCIDSDICDRPDPRTASGSAAAATAVSVSVTMARRGASPSRSSTGEESTVEKPDWKPSVYWVMLCLFIMSISVISISGVLFQQMEGWTFWESIYFSFVSYATIGLGDFVSLQKPNYGTFKITLLYRTLAFFLMIFGCCCIYSLLNVTSIVIKQFLNYIIKQMDYIGDWCCCAYCRCSAAKVRRRMSSKRRRPRSLRNLKNGPGRDNRLQVSVLSKSNSARAFALGHHPYDPEDMNSDGGLGGSRFDLDERRCSGENMISIRGELSNKVSLAVMQKRLYETAQMSRHSNDYPGSFSATSVGPLAIVTEKLGTDNPV